MEKKLLKLDRSRAVLLVIDVQERLAAAMPEEILDRARRNIAALSQGMARLGAPVLATEQYPRGLGPTLPDVRAALPSQVQPVEKVDFSCYAVPQLREALAATGRRQVVACGMETHVCVFQTARDLLAEGYEVFVPHDAVASRQVDNLRVGLDLISRAGGIITATETVLFDLLGRAGTPEFKAISALIK
jgi:nicotinamidase-related amidase